MIFCPQDHPNTILFYLEMFIFIFVLFWCKPGRMYYQGSKEMTRGYSTEGEIFETSISNMEVPSGAETESYYSELDKLTDDGEAETIDIPEDIEQEGKVGQDFLEYSLASNEMMARGEQAPVSAMNSDESEHEHGARQDDNSLSGESKNSQSETQFEVETAQMRGQEIDEKKEQFLDHSEVPSEKTPTEFLEVEPSKEGTLGSDLDQSFDEISKRSTLTEHEFKSSESCGKRDNTSHTVTEIQVDTPSQFVGSEHGEKKKDSMHEETQSKDKRVCSRRDTRHMTYVEQVKKGRSKTMETPGNPPERVYTVVLI